ncbi:MAG: TlpA family protein disulfide reductase [Myxococcales bacterium]|nr:TlpA family protein disulfide reductase [Myxococcales bacterium]
MSAEQAPKQSAGSLRLLVALVALGLAVYWFGRRSTGPETGAPAKDFALTVVAGQVPRVTLADLHGRPALIEVVASWCGVCRRAAPTLAAAARAPRKREVRFLAVSVDDDPNAARALARDWQIPYDVAHDDGSFARSYGISLLPTLVLIDETGRVRHVATGAPSPAAVERWLGDVGAERL